MRSSLLVLALVVLFSDSAWAAPHWVQVRSPHFIVLTDSDAQTARHVAGPFERMRAFFQTVLPHAAGDTDAPITVLAFRDEAGFKMIVPADHLGKKQARLAGYFLSQIDRDYVAMELDANFPHPYAVIYHEYTHFILRKDYLLPVWLQEGLAEYFQNTDITNTDVTFGQPDFNELRYLEHGPELLPLPKLFLVDQKSPYYHEEDKTSLFYLESWALTHMLESDGFQKRTQKIAQYDANLSNGQDAVTAARNSFGDLNLLFKQLNDYVSRLGFVGERIKMNFDVNEASFQEAPASIDEVDAIRAGVQLRVGRSADAKTLAEGVLARDPHNVEAEETMGFIALRSHDRAAARKNFDLAVQAAPDDYTANLYAAELDRDDPTQSAVAEAELRRCIKLQPHRAVGYNNLADLFVVQKRNLDEAYMLIIQAVQLDPQVLTYRYTASEVQEAQHNLGSAILVLNEAKAHVARTPQQAAEIDRRIERLKQEQSGLATPPQTTP